MSTENTEKKSAETRRPLLLCICGVLLAAIAAVLLFVFPQNSSILPTMELRGETYYCGMPFERTEEIYIDLMDNCDCSISTRTVDGVEFICGLSAGKPWPDSEPNRAATIGGLCLGDPESKLLEKFPKADTNGLRYTFGIYNPDETWEHYSVYFYEEKMYSPSEYEALLQSVSESEADTIRIRSYALVALTIRDEVDRISFGDYTALIQPMTQAMDGVIPYA